MKIITYPGMYFSENVSCLLNKKPQLPQSPIEPVKPVIPSDPGEYDSGGNRSCFLFAGIVIFIAIVSSDMDNKGSMILPMLGVLACSFFLFKQRLGIKSPTKRRRLNIAVHRKNLRHNLN